MIIRVIILGDEKMDIDITNRVMKFTKILNNVMFGKKIDRKANKTQLCCTNTNPG